MTKKTILSTVLMASMFASSVAVSAAQVTYVSGKVLLDRGQGFVPMVQGEVQPGNRIFVGKDAFAAVTYKNGCRLEMPAGTIAVVPAKAPCLKSAKVFTAASTIIPAQAAPDDLLPEGEQIVTDPVVSDPIMPTEQVATNGLGGFMADNGLLIGLGAAGAAVAVGGILVLSGVFDDKKTAATPVN